MQDWENIIKATTSSFKEEFDGLSLTQLNWKPEGNAWSVAQHIDHLIIINRSYFPTVKALKTGGFKPPFIGKFGFLVNFMGKELLKSVQPDKKKKIKTFPIWEPDKTAIAGDILDRFILHQNELSNMIRDAKQELPLDTVISSPANKHIVYKLEDAFDIIVTHEKRHLMHAKQVKIAMQQES